MSLTIRRLPTPPPCVVALGDVSKLTEFRPQLREQTQRRPLTCTNVEQMHVSALPRTDPNELKNHVSPVRSWPSAQIRSAGNSRQCYLLLQEPRRAAIG